MAKFYHLSLAMLAGALTFGASQQASARQLSVDEALASARMTSRAGILRASRSGEELKLVHTEKAADLSTLYVLNNEEGGYVILSADDVAVPVVGYSEEGSFDPENIPADLKAWLQHYSDEIVEATSTFVVPQAANQFATVSNKIKTSWTWGDPYNKDCPKIDGVTANAGSAAVAVAQIMRYHEWPEKGTGTVSYDYGAGELTCDFSTVSFDWAAMPNRVGGTSSADPATLQKFIQAVGYGIKTRYGVDNSFADASDVTYALVNYFGYDKGLNYLRRNFYTQSEWEQMIYDELVNNGPVYYDGKNSSYTGKLADGGFYSFVIAGYSSYNGFYLMFGNDKQGVAPATGYYKLSIIQGAMQPAPKYADPSGLNASQGAIFGLKKPVADSKENSVLYADGTLNIYVNKTPSGIYDATLPIKAANGKSNNMFCFFNGAGIRLACVPTPEIEETGLDFIVGLECEPENGGEKTYIGLTSMTALKPDVPKALGAAVGASYFTTNLDQGVNYNIRLVAQAGKAAMGQTGFNLFQPGIEYTPILSSVGDVSVLKFRYDDTYFYISAPEGQLPELSINKIGIYEADDYMQTESLTTIDAKETYNITANVTNNGNEYLGTIYPYLYDKFGHETKLAPVTVDITNGQTGEARWFTISFTDELYDSEYTLTLCDKYNNKIGEGIKFNVTNGKSLTDVAIIKSISFQSDLGDYRDGDITAPRVDHIFFVTAEIECLSSDFSKTIYASFYTPAGAYVLYDSWSKADLKMKKGDVYTYSPAEGIGDTKLNYDNLYQLGLGSYVSSGKYDLLTYEDGSDKVWIYVTTEKSGINVIKEDDSCTVYPNPAESVTTVSADAAISEIAVYSMNGSMVMDRHFDGSNTSEQLNVSTLPAGNYVLRIVADGQNKIARLIKR